METLDNTFPTVSVVIPTYNAPALLLETLETVFAQTFRDFEVVVVNDGSTDDTLRHLQPLADAGKIRLIDQKNGGIGVARNRGIDEARGKYIALLDHDDLWMPGKLAEQVAYAEAHPECSIVTVPWSHSTSPRDCVFPLQVADANGLVERPLRHMAQGTMLFCSSSMMFQKKHLGTMRYGEKRKCIEDQQVHLALLGNGKLGVAGNDILMVYRMHGSNYSSQAEYWDNGIRWLRTLERDGSFASLTGHDREDMLEFLAHFGRTATASRLVAGQRKQALQLYASEWRYQIADRAWKYLLGTPLLAGASRGLIRKAFGIPAPSPAPHSGEAKV
jgi:glycosyltransferase involved in cell wall biosynthesis